ncbi:MAG: hypothetical protein QF394_11945 [Rhodospirillales bacterium]|nr:hypothetical protein [Rhodospirillales bacterium]
MTAPDKIQPNAEIIHSSATRSLGLCEDMLAGTVVTLWFPKK